MQFKTVSILSLAAGLASAATGTNHDVAVGKSGLTFAPNSFNASVGDTVTFHFYPKDHSVVQAAFAKPCEPMANGFYSGFTPSSSGEANSTFVITINDTKPIWFYCSQGKHCQGGMVGAINQAATGAKTIEAFAAAAANATNNTTPTSEAGTGGMIMMAGNSMSSGSSSGSANSSANGTSTSAASSLAGSSAITFSSLFAFLAGATLLL